MTTGRGNLETSGDAWRGVRDDPDIQFEPIPPKPPEPPPQWWQDFERFLSDVFSPAGRALAESWPWLQWVLLGIGLITLAYVVWRLIEPSLNFTARETVEGEGWVPERAAAIALLEDADRLAEAGDYDGEVNSELRSTCCSAAALARSPKRSPDLLLPAAQPANFLSYPACLTRPAQLLL